ncbi:OGFOD2 [Symbiodinium natans]|uniref:OGFOD2 protein n=1 Tax=Symbiodinium natans TaxID=878477 RepID=A0A812QAP1_9DINO|nr:OGFOD2 [Symbiodinium natans]
MSGRLQFQGCVSRKLHRSGQELMVDLFMKLPESIFPTEAANVRLHFLRRRLFARWLLAPMVLQGQEETLSRLLEDLPGEQPLIAMVSVLWEGLTSLRQGLRPREQALLQRAAAYRQRPLHEVLFTTSWLHFLDPRLRLLLRRLGQGSVAPAHACARCRASQQGHAHLLPLRLLRKLQVEEISKNVYAFPALTPDFCRLFLEELDAFYASGLKSSRPNSMNRYGAVLEEVGLSLAVADFQRHVLLPLARALFPGIGDELDGHHAFVVHYRTEAGDRHLPPHRDDSEVTFNLALGRSWEGCRLIFCGLMQEPDVHRHQISHAFPGAGWAVLHLGRQVHAAEHILSGERTNLAARLLTRV